MSITVRLWTEEDLAKIGKNRKLTTIFMNCHTFSSREIVCYPYKLRKTYVASLPCLVVADEIDEADIVFFATDDDMAIWFYKEEYGEYPVFLYEKITTYREVDAKQMASQGLS